MADEQKANELLVTQMERECLAFPVIVGVDTIDTTSPRLLRQHNQVRAGKHTDRHGDSVFHGRTVIWSRYSTIRSFNRNLIPKPTNANCWCEFTTWSCQHAPTRNTCGSDKKRASELQES